MKRIKLNIRAKVLGAVAIASALFIGAVPITAFAGGHECICETKCTEDCINPDCELCKIDYTLCCGEEPAEAEPEEEPEILEISDDESLGDALTKLRGSVGCSLQDLANKTKIPIQKIRALEEGNYEQISNINVGADYVRKLCIEYVVAPEKYVLKFKEAYHAFANDEEPAGRSVSATSTGGLKEIEIGKKHFVSIPSLLIGTLIVVLLLFVLGGLAKLYFRKSAAKSPASLSELVPVNRGALTVLPIPEEQ